MSLKDLIEKWAEEKRGAGRAPVKPFYVDDEGDICDANGVLVCCPAIDVWPDDNKHAHNLCRALNGEPSTDAN